MINSLLELVGALFLASLPILLTLARIRRRRMRAAARAREVADTARAAGERADTGTDGSVRAPKESAENRRGAPQRSRARTAWLNRVFRRIRKSEASPAAPAHPAALEGAAQPFAAQKRRTTGSKGSQSSENWTIQGDDENRSLPQTQPGAVLLERVERYPPLQRAIVLTEILGPPKGLE